MPLKKLQASYILITCKEQLTDKNKAIQLAELLREVDSLKPTLGFRRLREDLKETIEHLQG